MKLRQTKIVATIGPASSSDEVLTAIIKQGADVLRLNFSHGTVDEHVALIRKIRALSDELGRHVAIMQDLCGPKIRVGRVQDGVLLLNTGASILLVQGEVEGNLKRISLTQDEVLPELMVGDRILINDGAVELRVAQIGDSVECKVTRGGAVASAKGVNFPDTDLSLPSVTGKDMADLEVGIAEGVDFIALSFVRKAEDLVPVRDRLLEAGCGAQLIAKIEKPAAIDNIDSIVSASDGILVARGDLGVETSLEEVPFLQKEIVRKANEQDKYVIVATQMLESMAYNPFPTRAEVSDVANAILDGADAVMLSVETSAGRYPQEALSEMMRIAFRSDRYTSEHRPPWAWDEVNPGYKVLDALGHAVQKFTEDLDPAAIITFTPTGGTALFISKNRPSCPVIAFTSSIEAVRRMNMFWGIYPEIGDIADADDLVKTGRRRLLEADLARKGDTILSVFDSDRTDDMGADSVRVGRV